MRTSSRCAPGDRVDDAEQIRVQRRLVEHLAAEPVAARRSAAPRRRSRASRPSAPRRTAPAGSAGRERGARPTRRRRSTTPSARARPTALGRVDGGTLRPPDEPDARRAAAGFLGDNSAMLVAQVHERRDRVLSCSTWRWLSRDRVCVRSPRSRVSRRGAARSHLHQRHRADRLVALRHLPSARRDRPVQPAHLRRRADARDADRGGHDAPDHAAVEARAPGTATSSTSGGSRTAQLQSIQRWIASGAPEGDAADLPPLPDWNDGWQLGTPDLVVRMPRAVHRAAPTAPTSFARSSSRFQSSRARYVRAIEFRPGNARVVHHANIGVDRTRSSRLLDARDPEPGYVGGMVPSSDAIPKGSCSGGRRGRRRIRSPAGMAWRLEPGSDLVVQLHLQPTGKPEPLQVVGRLVFHRRSRRRARRSACGSAARRSTSRPARRSTSSPTGTSCRWMSRSGRAAARAQPRPPDGTAAATLPDGSTRWLISIADWDFRWQDVYRYARPLVLPKGTTISMRYIYDNSAANPRNPHRPPARVVWGQNTSDEMGDLWIQMVPRASADFVASERRCPAEAPHAEDLAAYTEAAAGRSHQSAAPRRGGEPAISRRGRLDEAIVGISANRWR